MSKLIDPAVEQALQSLRQQQPQQNVIRIQDGEGNIVVEQPVDVYQALATASIAEQLGQLVNVLVAIGTQMGAFPERINTPEQPNPEEVTGDTNLD